MNSFVITVPVCVARLAIGLLAVPILAQNEQGGDLNENLRRQRKRAEGIKTR